MRLTQEEFEHEFRTGEEYEPDIREIDEIEQERASPDYRYIRGHYHVWGDIYNHPRNVAP